MKSNYYSVCVLNKEEESECVVKSINLIGAILNCPYSREDSNVLLICTRSAWDRAIESVDYNIAASFYTNTVDDSVIDHSNCQNDSTDFVHNLFKRCFGEDMIKIDAADWYSTPNSEESTDTSEDEDEYDSYTSSDQSNSDSTEDDNNDSINSESNNFFNRVGKSSNNFIDVMRRVLIRFVDETPSRRIIDGKLINRLHGQDQNSCFWNYIQATNEISIHEAAVDFVVVASLSAIVTKSIPNYLKDYSSHDPHPFESSLTKEGKIRYSKTKIISMYTMALATSLNAMNSKIKSLQNISECSSTLLPRFILVDSLPPDEEDSDKFIKFISERFGYTFVVR